MSGATATRLKTAPTPTTQMTFLKKNLVLLFRQNKQLHVGWREAYAAWEFLRFSAKKIHAA